MIRAHSYAFLNYGSVFSLQDVSVCACIFKENAVTQGDFGGPMGFAPGIPANIVICFHRSNSVTSWFRFLFSVSLFVVCCFLGGFSFLSCFFERFSVM